MTTPSSKYGRIFDLVPEMVFILGKNHEIVDHNRAAAERTGFSSKQLAHRTMPDLVPKNHLDNFLKFLQSSKDSSSLETQFRKADDSFLEISVTLRILDSENTSVSVILALDITEQKKKELDLLRFSNVIEHTVNPIQITDARGLMVYVNPAFERNSGYRRDELIGKNPSILSSGKHPKDFWSNVWQYILTGKVWVGQLENKRKDGSAFHTELVISPIVDGNQKVVGFLGAHRDITDQKMLEQQLVRSQKMEAIGTLAAGIAHEVGNPLTSISSLVQVIQRTIDDRPTLEKLELIKNQVNRISKTIRDLVDFSRPSNYVVTSTSLNKILEDALTIVRYGKDVKRVKFRLQLEPSLPELQTVPDQLVQVFINILMNAVDALEGERGEIRVESLCNSEHFHVRIQDTGKGISSEDREKIFEPFYTTKETGKGTGLGLWVSYGIVKNFGGDILVESNPGKGSIFTVLLPVKGT